MAKPDTLFKRTTNWLLDFIAANDRPKQALPGEKQLAAEGDVSRTTIRTALDHLERHGIIERRDRVKVVTRLPTPTDYFEVSELVARSDQIQSVFMERIFRGQLTPGHSFSEAAISREASASTASVREFLIGFSRYGLIEKKARGGWRLRAFDSAFARELADMRDLLELKAMTDLRHLTGTDPFWNAVDQITEKHRQMKVHIAEHYDDFPLLDVEFHTLLVRSLDNRFAYSFYDIISFIFHYHYQWMKNNELQSNTVAVTEHLAILDALQLRDFAAALEGMRIHLVTARENLLRSIAGTEP